MLILRRVLVYLVFLHVERCFSAEAALLNTISKLLLGGLLLLSICNTTKILGVAN